MEGGVLNTWDKEIDVASIEQVVRESDQIPPEELAKEFCANCSGHIDEHVDGKCLFDSSTFQPMTKDLMVSHMMLRLTERIPALHKIVRKRLKEDVGPTNSSRRSFLSSTGSDDTPTKG